MVLWIESFEYEIIVSQFAPHPFPPTGQQDLITGLREDFCIFWNVFIVGGFVVCLFSCWGSFSADLAMIDTTVHDCLVSTSMKETLGTPQLSRWRAKTSLWAQLNTACDTFLKSVQALCSFPKKQYYLRTVQQPGFLETLFFLYRILFRHWQLYKRCYFSEFLYLCNIVNLVRNLHVHFYSFKPHWTEYLLPGSPDLILTLLKGIIHCLVAWWLLENKLENVQVCKLWC